MEDRTCLIVWGSLLAIIALLVETRAAYQFQVLQVGKLPRYRGINLPRGSAWNRVVIASFMLPIYIVGVALTVSGIGGDIFLRPVIALGAVFLGLLCAWVGPFLYLLRRMRRGPVRS